uniref:Uncharacterized protein n=1 Tax=Physcomitrium patens TaxID=3218 RepID=A0A2K1L4G6_PHYPA|nr:hypothetical protein PHYPA_003709 [Physcomitrium patens]
MSVQFVPVNWPCSHCLGSLNLPKSGGLYATHNVPARRWPELSRRLALNLLAHKFVALSATLPECVECTEKFSVVQLHSASLSR